MRNTKNFFLIIISIMVFVIFSVELLVMINNNKAELTKQMNAYLLSRAEKEAAVLDSRISEVGVNGRALADIISNDEGLDFDFYNRYIKNTLEKQTMAFGMGYWFEPYYTSTELEYFGPYTYKDDKGKIVVSMIYSNEQYDYFSWDWYHDGIVSITPTHFTEPYYDEVLETVFATVTNKIVRENKVVGVVSIDMTLREMKEYISSIKIGKNGKAFVLADNGMLIGENQVSTKDKTPENQSDSFKAISEASDEIISSLYMGNKTYDGYIIVWAPIGQTNMNVVFCYPEKEIMTGIYDKTKAAIAIFAVTMLVFMLVLNITLKRFFENPLRKILKYNISSKETEKLITEKNDDAQPSFNDMLTLINRLFEERNSSIEKLHDKNLELEFKNEEVEALYQQTAAMNDTLNNLLDEVRDGYIVTVRALSNAIEANDKYTKGHCERVTEYSLKTATMFNFKKEELINLEYASVLHDVGKIGIPNSILNKPGKLTNEEYEFIMEHPRMGYEILKDIKFLKHSIDIILHHHERVDGKGYPDGLVGNEIELAVKILTVADAYDAMTSSRPYRDDFYTKEEAVEILKENAGTQFDAEVVKVFVTMIRRNI